MRKHALTAPLIGGVSTSTATGYWLLGRDGGIFTFGSAHFYGSTGAMQLNKPINVDGTHRRQPRATGSRPVTAASSASATPTSTDRWVPTPTAKPIVGIERTPSGNGYWEYATDGTVFPFGDAHAYGSPRHEALRPRSCRCKPPPPARATGSSPETDTSTAYGDAATYGRHRRMHQLRHRRRPPRHTRRRRLLDRNRQRRHHPLRRRQQPRLPHHHRRTRGRTPRRQLTSDKRRADSPSGPDARDLRP